MKPDQVELLTRQKQAHRKGDVRHILDNLPVKGQKPPVESMKDAISQESDDPTPPGESQAFQAFLTGLSWATYALAIAAGVLLAMTATEAILTHLARP
jgi:hypothetical protein